MKKIGIILLTLAIGIAGYYSYTSTKSNDINQSKEILKEKVETTPYSKQTILETQKGIFPATKYLMIKHIDFPIQKLTGEFFGENYAKLTQSGADFIENGTPAAFYFDWDYENMKTTMAVALPINSDFNSEKKTVFEVLEIPKSDSYFIDYHGKYEELSNAHETIHQYLKENDITSDQIAIEQYITDPSTSPNPKDWQTKVSYITK